MIEFISIPKSHTGELHSKGEAIEVIPLHFNVPEHYLSLDEFIIYARDTVTILDNFNAEFCSGELQYQILILPPEVGSFKSKIGVYIKKGTIGVGIFWAFCNSDIGSAYINGLTGHSSAYWTEKLGKETKEILDKKESKENSKYSAVIMAECTKGFFQKNIEELQQIGISTENFRSAYQARNEFYRTCLNNKNVQGVGFDDSENFPVHRSNFSKFIIELPPPEEEKTSEEESNWWVEKENIIVTSPNWERKDDRNRHWKAKYAGDKVALFIMEDEIFWHHVIIKDLHPKIYDNMEVQWAFNIGAQNKRKNIRVLRVLEYNGAKISQPLTEEELSLMLSTYSVVENNTGQGNLFDYVSPNSNEVA